jgi:Glycosyl hydrolase family 76
VRATTAAAVSLLCALVVVPWAAAGVDDASRAVASYVAMERYLFDARSGTYRETVGGTPYADAWPVSQAVAATVALTKVSGAGTDARVFADRGFAELAGLRAGSLYRSSWGRADVYFDDNAWIAQDLLDRGDPKSLRAATAIFSSLVHAWDADATHPCAGGVYWTTVSGEDDRNTVSTANAALVVLRLYAIERNPALLYWARRMLDWLDACMLAPDGLYRDHVDATGAVDGSEWSYNQGALIGDYVTLFHVTHDPAALARAEAIADAALAHFASRWLVTEPPEFASIFFRRLLELAAVDRRQSYVDAAETYGTNAWNSLRDPQTGLFAFPGSEDLLVQASFVQLYAELATFTGTQAAS